ncbi:MAG: SURF1 family protein [Dehalococcoidia bacterium]|nr:SURF1 family protein [Dehalococcoidia bacterium]
MVGAFRLYFTKGPAASPGSPRLPRLPAAAPPPRLAPSPPCGSDAAPSPRGARGDRVRFRLPTPVLAALLVAAVATLLALGVWQLQRNAERNHLVAERNARLAGAPVPVAEAARPLATLDYRLVSATGTWDVGRAMVLANRARFATKGEEIVVPLLLAPGGPAILVNRGWYADGRRDAVLAELVRQERSSTPGQAEGLARYAEGLRGNRTAAGTWTQISPADMGATLPYPILPWFVIEGRLLSDTGYGRPDTLLAQGFYPYASAIPHLEYALTWFGIAAALVAVAVMRLVVAPRRERAARAAREAAP